MQIKNDMVYMDIYAMEPKFRKKLHLTNNELEFTNEDMILINGSDYVNIDELKKILQDVQFKDDDIQKEIGISKGMYSMAFSPNETRNSRGLRMRTVLAVLNAIRRRGITTSFKNVFIYE